MPSSTGRADPVGAENCVTVCDLGILMDQSAEPGAPQDPNSRAFCGLIGSPGGRVLVQRPVWPAGVVVVDVFVKDGPKIPFTSDQQLVRAFAAGAADPAFRD